MNIENLIRNCELEINQLNHYQPNPFYVEYFFRRFLHNVNLINDLIFKEADIDFGLFCKGNISQDSFIKKAKEKNDLKALEFSSWFSKNNNIINEQIFTKFINHFSMLEKKKNQFPQIKIMLRSQDRYENDIHLPVYIRLSNNKIISKEELKIEINRQSPLFLKLINTKRMKNKEPKIKQDEIIVSTFIDFEGREIEIGHSAEIYIPIIKRIYDEAIKRIRELTKWG
jgi:hypothetical protein